MMLTTGHVEETGATFIHPYDDDYVIAGQATIGLEILDQLEDVEAVIVPIGGGGLISGISFAVKSLKPDVKIYGVQAAGAASMYNSFKAHERRVLDSVSTFADGIAVKNPGENTYDIISKYVDDIVCVSEDEIAARSNREAEADLRRRRGSSCSGGNVPQAPD